MNDIIADLKSAIKVVEQRPCECVTCPDCRGLGNIRVDFITGLPSAGCDDLDELEPCDQCQGGVVETCERCMEMEELYEQIDEEEERRLRVNRTP